MPLFGMSKLVPEEEPQAFVDPEPLVAPVEVPNDPPEALSDKRSGTDRHTGNSGTCHADVASEYLCRCVGARRSCRYRGGVTCAGRHLSMNA